MGTDFGFQSGYNPSRSIKLYDATTTKGLCYIAEDEDWVLTDNSEESLSKGFLGIALGTSSGVSGMLLEGVVTLPYSLSGTTGALVYLHDNEGEFTTNLAGITDSDYVVRIVGYLIGTNTIYFKPSNDYVVLL